MIDDTTDETNDLPDAFGVRGSAAAVSTTEGERQAAVIRGSYRLPEETVRVLLDVEETDGLLDTDRTRVEVLS